MDAFVLTHAALDMCLEIPSADDGGEFDPVELHAHCHGGLSQAGQGVVCTLKCVCSSSSTGRTRVQWDPIKYKIDKCPS